MLIMKKSIDVNPWTKKIFRWVSLIICKFIYHQNASNYILGHQYIVCDLNNQTWMINHPFQTNIHYTQKRNGVTLYPGLFNKLERLKCVRELPSTRFTRSDFYWYIYLLVTWIKALKVVYTFCFMCGVKH